MRAIFSTKQAKLVAYALNHLSTSPTEANKEMKRMASDLVQYINKTEWETSDSWDGLPSPEQIEAHDFEDGYFFFVTPNQELLGLHYIAADVADPDDEPNYTVYDFTEAALDDDLIEDYQCYTYRELQEWYNTKLQEG